MSSKKSKLILKIGMLWYDKDASDVYDMIGAASAHYFAKFGTAPQYCHVHPVMFKDEEKIVKRAGDMTIVLDKMIRPNHAWLGVIQ